MIRFFTVIFLLADFLVLKSQYITNLAFSRSGDLHRFVYDYEANANGELHALFIDENYYRFLNNTFGKNNTSVFGKLTTQITNELNGFWNVKDLENQTPIYWRGVIYLPSTRGDSTLISRITDSFKVIDLTVLKFKGIKAKLINCRKTGKGMLWKMSTGEGLTKRNVWKYFDSSGNSYILENTIESTDAFLVNQKSRLVLEHYLDSFHLSKDSSSNIIASIPMSFGRFNTYFQTQNSCYFIFLKEDTLGYLYYNFITGKKLLQKVRIIGGNKTIDDIRFVGNSNQNGIFVSGTFRTFGLYLVNGKLGAFLLKINQNAEPEMIGGYRYSYHYEDEESFSWADKIIPISNDTCYVGIYSNWSNYISSPSHPGWIPGMRIDVNKANMNNITETGWYYPLKTKQIHFNPNTIFPNPVKDKLYLKNGSFQFYEICDMTGRVLKEGDSSANELDVSFLNSGNYFLKTMTKSGETKTYCFIKY